MNIVLSVTVRLLACLAMHCIYQSTGFASVPEASFRLLPGTRSGWAVSGDGSTVIGTTGIGVGYNTYRWTAAEGVQLLGRDLQLRDVSYDGDVVVGQMIGGPGFRHSLTRGILSAPGTVIEVRGTSTDGNILAGSYSGPSGREAYRWTEDRGLLPIGDLPGGGYFSIAESVSGDGSVIVGQSLSAEGAEPYLWTESEGIRSLGAISGEPFDGWAFDISGDGEVVVGLGRANSVAEAFTWTRDGGRQDLGDLPGGEFYSFAHGVSQNGSVVVGIGTDNEGETAFVWDRLHGMRSLRDVLRSDFGIDIGVRLYSAWDVSADGRTIIGTAINSSGNYQGYVAVLPFVVPEPSSLTLFALSCVAIAHTKVRWHCYAHLPN